MNLIPDIPSSKSHIHFPFLRSFQGIHPSLRPSVTLCKMLVCCGKELLDPSLPNLENHFLTSFCKGLSDIFTATPLYEDCLFQPQPQHMSCHAKVCLFVI
jgi:hypothetical protein